MTLYKQNSKGHTKIADSYKKHLGDAVDCLKETSECLSVDIDLCLGFAKVVQQKIAYFIDDLEKLSDA